MNALREALDSYLLMRRGLGYSLKAAGKTLSKFLSFLEERGATYITTDLAAEWSLASGTQQFTHSMTLSTVRGFARYLSATDPRTEVPPYGLISSRPPRARPYLYSDAEILKLLDAALALPPANGLRPYTYYCLLGLLAVSGLRIGEAFFLKQQDVNLKTGMITVRKAKFGKSRLVPLHRSATEALTAYAQRRDRFLSGGMSEHFFVTDRGKPMDKATVYRTFYDLSRQTGLRGPLDHSGPRLHDFRHRFAVETLLRWYRSGEDVERKLPVLSTYLGHSHSSDTYWYLSLCPELMGLAVGRLEKRWEGWS